MKANYPLPSEALDDRLGFVGISGSGKTYGAGTAIEWLLDGGARVIIVDPLDVWWGLRLSPDGKKAGFDLPIFGGAHGDLPLNEGSGKLIGETVARMAESCIVSLGSLGTKSAERRFMLAFLESLYRNANGEPVHLIFDEADLWAPQRTSEPMLQSRMEEIVRRGRVKGFIPWLITQRPAVLSKDVLSQVDGLVAFKLTSKHDRDAIGSWVEGQADREEWRRKSAEMPTLARGSCIVWLPARGVLETTAFPKKVTYDSSRTPKRGEKRATAAPKPLDLGKLRERLAAVEESAKANDPATLRAEIDRLRKAAATADKGASVEQVEGVRDAARKRGYEEGFDYGYETAHRAFSLVIAKILEKTKTIPNLMNDAVRELMNEIAPPSVKPRPTPAPKPGIAPAVAKASRVVERVPQTGGDLPAPEQKIVDAIRWWNALGVASPSQAQVAFVAGYSHKSGTWSTYLGRLRSAGMIEGRGELLLTSAGAAVAREPSVAPTAQAVQDAVLEKIDGPLRKILAPLLRVYPDDMTQSDLASEAGYSSSSGTWSTYLGRLRKLDLIDGRGRLTAQGWMFP